MAGTPKQEREDEILKQNTARTPATPVGVLNLDSKTPTLAADVASSGSIQTVRRDNNPSDPNIVVRTPSFPFPVIDIDSGTPPLATPPSHLPFTSLSPTVSPAAQPSSASRIAKNKIAKEFQASGRLPPLTAPNVLPRTPSVAGTSLLEPYDIAVRLQTEPGLTGWWRQITQILKESFSATRASLAIPSDKTDIENVPWAQLAEFSASDDDGSISPQTAGVDSTRASLSSSLIGERTTAGEAQQAHDKQSTKLSTATRSTRPKLDTRHSYAGYPRRSPLKETPTLSIKRPHLGRAESQASLIGTLLNAKVSDAFDDNPSPYDDIVSSPVSEDTTNSSQLPARVLETPRPLEADVEPLITSSGVVRVLNNSSATILTRRYNILEESPGVSPVSQNIPPHGSGTQLPKNSVPGNSHSRAKKHTRRRTVSTTRSSTGATSESTLMSRNHRVAYEDYEQTPGTPWAQSPAPSPAALGENESNPFFTVSSVQQSFRKNPPGQKFTTGQQFEAIGLDISHSIIQLPLIHPSVLLSQPQRTHRARVDKAKDAKGQRRFPTIDHKRANSAQKRRVPLAILSILVPTAPFPQEYIQFLNSLSTMLATSFYAANQHTNLQREVTGLALERNRAIDRLPLHSRHSDSQGSDVLSPISNSSTERSTPSLDAIRESGSSDGQSRVKTPGSKTYTLSPGRDSYFASSNTEVDKGLSQGLSLQSSSSNSRSSQPMPRNKTHSTLHSHGASFQRTHPHLPKSTAVDRSGDEQSDSETGNYQFKEPSTSMLRSMIDIGATQHLIAEPDSGQLLWVNSKFQAYRSSSSVQRLDDFFWNSIYHKDRKNFKREWTHSLETGEQLSQQVRMERFDGQHRWFHLKFLPLKNDLGVIKFWSGQAMDIHDLHEAEVKAAKSKEKAASEAKYRAIANSLPVIVFAASVPAGMTFANTQWLSYSGQSLEQALGFGFLDHVHPEDLNKCRFPGSDGSLLDPTKLKFSSKLEAQRAALRRHDSATSSAGESDAPSTITEKTVRPGQPEEIDETDDLMIPNELLKNLAKEGTILCARDGQGNLSITTEMRLKSKDDEYRWHLVQGSYIESVNFGQGDAQWFIACTDISNQKKNEAKIQEANSALENVNSALEREMQQKMSYLSSMSHEIRTPLNSIIGNLQFLVQSGLEESALEWAHGAKETAIGMHELINDVLDLSKAEAKMLKLQSYWFDPRELGEQIMDILNPKATVKKVELAQETLSDVPHSIRGDAGRIKQVLLNLATNAIKFTNEGEVVVRCELQGELPPDVDLPPLKSNETYIRWTITDTGIGFTQADKKLLFKAYSQIKNKANRDVAGTGLGLILCKTMVNLHGGDIDAYSVPGRGSTFSFFAKFRIRPDTVIPGGMASEISTPAVATPLPSSVATQPNIQVLQTPGSRRESPALSSDSSTALSLHSSIHQRSVRSSISTLDSVRPQSPLKLSLPLDHRVPSDTKSLVLDDDMPPTPDFFNSRPQSRRSDSENLSTGDRVSPLNISVNAIASVLGETVPISAVSIPKRSDPVQTDITIDSDRANFRPPMLSILVVCPPKDTRRITCDKIQSIVPQSAPCNIASEGTFHAAYELLFGNEPTLFTHIVVRTVVDQEALELIDKLLASPVHTKASIVVLTDHTQFINIKRGLPHLDFDALNQVDRVKKVLKPIHPAKLARIFDPFNENTSANQDRKEIKRKAGDRRTKEDFTMFKTSLSGKGLEILAVEDDKMQMNILNSFMVKVCGLNVTKATNGAEALKIYLDSGPGRFSVIVSDTEMPVMDGLTMCRRIREEERRHGWAPVNIVSLSANVLTKGWTEAADAGFSHYCAKPVSFNELGRLLIELTDSKRPHLFLRDRPKSKALLKALGELDENEEDGDDADDEEYRKGNLLSGQ